MSKIDAFLKAVLDGAQDLAGEYIKGAHKRGLTEMRGYVEARAEDVERWTRLLESGELTEQDFRHLLLALKDGAEIRTLRIAGVELARLQRLRDALVDLVIDKALGTFLP